MFIRLHTACCLWFLLRPFLSYQWYVSYVPGIHHHVMLCMMRRRPDDDHFELPSVTKVDLSRSTTIRIFDRPTVFMIAFQSLSAERSMRNKETSLFFHFLFSSFGGWGKNKALAHHTSTYFHARRVSIELSCFRSPTLAGAPFGSHCRSHVNAGSSSVPYSLPPVLRAIPR